MNPKARPRSCSCEGFTWVYQVFRSPIGSFAVKILCDACGREGLWPWMAKEEWPVGWDRIPPKDMKSHNGGPCDRCGTEGHRERHHWAPSHIFGWPESDSWPTSLLCPTCHREWHRVMRDWAKGQGGAK